MRCINRHFCNKKRLGFYDERKIKAKLRLVLWKKVKSQMCAWTTSATVCAEGFVKKIVRKNLQLCAKGPVAVCAAF